MADTNLPHVRTDAENRVLSEASGQAFEDGVNAQIAAQETPAAEGATAADQLITAVDAVIRQRWGPLPWVRYTRSGRVLSVNAAAHTCRVRIPEDGAAGQPDVSGTRTVRTGIGTPTVGRTYAVHFPYTLPDAPTALITGPVPAGDPWLKAPSGQTWLYYAARTPTDGFGWYRVPLPAGGPDPPTYADTDALLVALRGARPPDYLNWGGSNLTGIAPTYATRHLWMEDCGWPNNRDALFGAFGVTRPWRTLLRRYPAWGADPDHPVSQDGDGLLTSYPWLHLTGTNLDQGADADYFLGGQYAIELLTLPLDNPTFLHGQPFASIRLTLANSTGGMSWGVKSSAVLYSQKTKITYDDANGYHSGAFNYTEGDMADAAGWTADVTSTWGRVGQRISYWAVQQLTPDPFPDELELIPLSQPRFVVDRLNLSPSRIRVFVAQDGDNATEMNLPGQPRGWVSPYPGFALRPIGGGSVRAWWCGMPSFIQHHDVTGGPIGSITTPIQLWRGEINLVTGVADWTITGGPGLNQLIAVNQDASVVLAAVHTDAVGATSGSEIVYLTQNAGETWVRLPALPHAVNWGQDRLVARLIDTP